VEATRKCSVIESYQMENGVLNRPPQDDTFAALILVPNLKAVGRPAAE
jgi:hypothetical protein